MHYDVQFGITKQTFEPQFGVINNISDGGYERGYATGYEEGKVEYSDLFYAYVSGEIGTYSNETQTTIRAYAFYDCIKLEQVDLPLLKNVPTYCFGRCQSLTRLVFPSITGALNTHSFNGCLRLEYLDVGKASNIANYSFYNCRALRTLIIRTEKVCTVAGVDVFTQTPIAKGTGFIYVPDNLVEQYKTATNWSTYAAQIRPISELPQE